MAGVVPAAPSAEGESDAAFADWLDVEAHDLLDVLRDGDMDGHTYKGDRAIGKIVSFADAVLARRGATPAGPAISGNDRQAAYAALGPITREGTGDIDALLRWAAERFGSATQAVRNMLWRDYDEQGSLQRDEAIVREVFASIGLNAEADATPTERPGESETDEAWLVHAHAGAPCTVEQVGRIISSLDALREAFTDEPDIARRGATPAGPAGDAYRAGMLRAADIAKEIEHRLLASNDCDDASGAYDVQRAIREEADKPSRATAEAIRAEEPQAWRDVLAERRRQVEAEGWTTEHDDRHGCGELVRAAFCYALGTPTSWRGGEKAPLRWPWEQRWWKPGTKRRNTVKAAALLLAELERLDRKAARPQSNTAAPAPAGQAVRS